MKKMKKMKKFLALFLVFMSVLSVSFMPTKKVQATPQTTVVYKTIETVYSGGQQIGIPKVTFSDGSSSDPSTTSFTHVVKEYLGTKWHHTGATDTMVTSFKFTITERF